MSYSILLYGATGYTGRLIAAEGAREQMSTDSTSKNYRMILAGRDGPHLKELADLHRMNYRVFALDDHEDIVNELSDVDVVINAAGPFAWTAERLCKAALEADSHYVDINGEVDVYKRLDDLGWYAEQRDLAIVCSAGHTAAASDLLLEAALRQLIDHGKIRKGELLGSIRIAMSRVVNFTRGSAETLARSLREQVTVVRNRTVRDKAGHPLEELFLSHVPVGKLERTFDFRRRNDRDADLRIASAANLVDTLTARLTVARKQLGVRSIESYVESSTFGRIGYQLGALLAPMSALPWVRTLVEASVGMLPEGPTIDELDRESHAVVLEIEDVNRTRVIDWRWGTPNVYQLTAQLVVAAAKQVATGSHIGWRTPAEVLPARKPEVEEHYGALRGCHLAETVG
jgi:short subunit dehydrogenase-like uncharacterized protein